MRVVKQSRLIAGASLLVAGCFCLLSMAQIARPLGSFRPTFSAALAAPQHYLTCHTLQEVSPRGAQPQAPYAVGLLPVVAVIRHPLLPRMTAYIPPWPMENWQIHRRLPPAGADYLEPA
jgi:hypothetical protein